VDCDEEMKPFSLFLELFDQSTGRRFWYRYRDYRTEEEAKQAFDHKPKNLGEGLTILPTAKIKGCGGVAFYLRRQLRLERSDGAAAPCSAIAV
jgi:hypothetical protein